MLPYPNLPRRLVTPALLGALLAPLAACNSRDAMTTEIAVVARAGAHELAVDELADIVARTPGVVLARAAVERWVQLWIDYSLFAQRLAAGDSLLDSAAVRAGTWFEIDSVLVAKFQRRLRDSLMQANPVSVDSAFAAGEHRLVDILVFQTPRDLGAEARAERGRAAARVGARLAGGASWDDATRVVTDPQAGARAGRMLLTRAALPPALGDSVFALQPGAHTGVLEAPTGFYVVRRPTLDAARADYEQALRDTLVQRAQAEYLVRLSDRWRIRVRRGAPALARQAAEYPYQAAGSRDRLATFEGGVFTVGDFVRWLPATGLQGQIRGAGDEPLRQLIESLARNEVLFLEARRLGIELDSAEYRRMRDLMAERVTEVHEALNLDVLLSAGAAPDLQRRLVQLAVASHVEEVMGNRRRPAVVPQFLGELLRRTGSWDVSYPAVDRAVEQGRTLRMEFARAAGGGALRPPLPAPGGGRESGR